MSERAESVTTPTPGESEIPVKNTSELITPAEPPPGLTKQEPPKPAVPDNVVNLPKSNGEVKPDAPRTVGIDDLFSTPGEPFVPKKDVKDEPDVKDGKFESVGNGEPAKKRGRKPIPVGPPVDYGKLANIVFDLGVGTLTTALGPEWQPESPQERAAVVEPLAVYMESQGMQDLPPGVVLSIVVIAYSARRVNHPNTKAKLTYLGNKIKNKLGRKPKFG